MILNVQEFSLFIDHHFPFQNYIKLYENITLLIHLFLLSLSILIMTFYEDVTTPIFLWSFELGIFIYHYGLFKTYNGFYFSFFVLYTVTIIYYFVNKIRKNFCKENNDDYKDDDFDLKENYNKYNNYSNSNSNSNNNNINNEINDKSQIDKNKLDKNKDSMFIV
jgi:hypothetical protein